MNFENKYERISLLLSLLLSDADYFVISEVAKKTGIPVSVIRNDIKVIAQSSKLINLKQRELKLLADGKYDDQIIETNPSLLIDGDFLLPIKRQEYQFINGWLGKPDEIYHLKSTYEKFPDGLKEKIRTLNHAINMDLKIYYDYKIGNGKEKLKFQRSKPVLVRVSPEDPGNAKCITDKGMILTIMSMDRISIEGEKGYVLGEITDDFSQTDVNWNLVWGYPDSINHEPFHVIIEIKATRNIKVKFENAIAERQTTGKRFEYVGAGRYIYEDDIVGEAGFRVWLRSFGSSVKVIEPKWLAEKIVNDFEKMKQQYEKGEFI